MHILNTKKVIAAFLILIVYSSFMTFLAFSPELSYVTVVTEGSQNIGVSFVVCLDGSTYFARNGATGDIDFEGTNRTAVIVSCISDIGANNGTIILGSGVNFNPNATAYNNNIIIKYADGTSVWEEWDYKLLVALTSPSIVHMEAGAFDFTPTETIYSSFKNYVCYAGLDSTPITNYVITEAPTSPLRAINRHTTGEGAIADNGAGVGSFMYVTEAEVDNISNAKSLWYRRQYWLMHNSPTRIVVRNVPQYYDDFRYNTSITVGDYGSLITTFYDASWEAKILAVTGGTTIYPAGSHTYAWDDVLGNNQGAGMGWKMCNLYMPLNATIDGDGYDWYLGVRGVDVGIGWTSYAIIDKYDLPSWWSDF